MGLQNVGLNFATCVEMKFLDLSRDILPAQCPVMFVTPAYSYAVIYQSSHWKCIETRFLTKNNISAQIIDKYKGKDGDKKLSFMQQFPNYRT